MIAPGGDYRDICAVDVHALHVYLPTCLTILPGFLTNFLPGAILFRHADDLVRAVATCGPPHALKETPGVVTRRRICLRSCKLEQTVILGR
jgi:hypothetical protein